LSRPELAHLFVAVNAVLPFGIDAEGDLGELGRLDGRGQRGISWCVDLAAHGDIVRRNELLGGNCGTDVNGGPDRNYGTGAQRRLLEHGHAGGEVGTPAYLAAQQRRLWPDKHMVVDAHSAAQYRVLANDRALADLDSRVFRIEHRAVHDPGSRANADLADQRGGRRNIGTRVNIRGITTMTNEHDRILPLHPAVLPGYIGPSRTAHGTCRPRLRA